MSDKIRLEAESLKVHLGSRAIEIVDRTPMDCPNCPTNFHAVCLYCRNEGKVITGRFLGYEIYLPAGYAEGR